MAALVTCLPCKHDDLTSDPASSAHIIKRSGVVVHACGTSAGEGETGESLALAGQPAELNQ